MPTARLISLVTPGVGPAGRTTIAADALIDVIAKVRYPGFQLPAKL
jgi:hypothetical protein